MNGKGIAAAIGAIGASLATLACCLPIGLVGAAGVAATLAAVAQAGRPWLLGLSFVLLGFGFAQAWQSKRCGAKPNWVALAMLALAGGLCCWCCCSRSSSRAGWRIGEARSRRMKRAITVASVALALVVLAAGWYYWGPVAMPAGQLPLVEITPQTIEQLRAEFNAHVDKPRIVALLSPT